LPETFDTDDTDWSALFGIATRETRPPPPLGGLVWRPALYSRNGVAWACARAWAASAKKDDVAALKEHKRLPISPILHSAAEELARIARRLFGSVVLVTNVPCGHSQKPDCFGKQLAVAAAERLDVPFAQCFADRFVKGVSHPKEFAKLPPLEWIERPVCNGLVLLVDDVATSGWHVEEGLTALRDAGFCATGLVWISGTVGPKGSPSSAVEIDWTGIAS